MQEELAEPDISLLRTRPVDLKLGPLYLQHFEKGPKHLFYIGTHHGTDTHNQSHEIIGQALIKYKPQCVVIEGIDTAKGFFPSTSVNLSLPAPQQLVQYQHAEENVHTAELLRKQHIPFIGGEPTAAECFGVLQQHGYTAKEAMGLYLLRMIPQWKRDGLTKDKAQLDGQIATYLAGNPQFSHLSGDQRLTREEFAAWYDQHKAELGNKDYTQVIAQDSNTNPGADANYFQKMTNILDQVRDQNLVTTVNEALKHYDRVMVIYGATHQYVSQPVYERMFGNKGLVEQLVLQQVPPPSVAPAPVTPSPKSTQDSVRFLSVMAGLGAIVTGGALLKSTQKTYAKVTGWFGVIVGLLAITKAIFFDKVKQDAPESALAEAQPVPTLVPITHELATGSHVVRLQQEQAPALMLQK